MPKVLVLPEHIASQIAAGEVVERPASAVKELVENAIDAGATKIVVSVSEGCRSIRVADNGSGMDAEDAVLAFQRHATSKLTSADQLWDLNTLGFRGEALPSIAAVSRVTCFTRTADSTTGTKIDCADGTLKSTETGCAPGTVVEVCDLFYNVPARLNFLKRAATEFGHIQETIQNLAICYPNVSFELLDDDEQKLRTSGSGDFRQAGLETGHLHSEESLIPISAADPDLGLSLKGQIARPVHFRGDRKGILSIVNNRPVRCQIMYKALDYAYADLIPRGRYPIAVLVLKVRANNLDVNIHPTKKEIKYSIGNDVYSFVQRQLVRALRESSSPARIHSYPSEPLEVGSVSETGGAFPRVYQGSRFLEPSSSPVLSSKVRDLPEQQSFMDNLRRGGDLSPGDRGDFRMQVAQLPCGAQSGPALPDDWKVLGYLRNTYFLLETPEGLLIVEQHIAHERVIYEHLLTQQSLESGKLTDAQTLIISCPLRLTAEQVTCLAENLDAMKDLGFEFERDNGSFACVQVPAELAHRDYGRVVQEIIQSLSESSAPNVKMELTKSLACQSAVKNGMALSDAQIVKLLNDWLNAPRNETCPHGRPISLPFSMDKLFALFHP
jgi:DNA mismatch repair protein MutL